MSAKPEAATHLASSAGRRPLLWRLFATGLSFVVFGASALAIGTWLTGSQLLLHPAEKRRQRARAMVQAGMRFFVRWMTGLGLLSYDIRGAEKLGRPGQLIVANHPSLIDIVFLMAFAPSVGCIVKQAMLRHPLTRAAARAAGYISNEPAADMIETAAQALSEGQSLIVFPEGTRTRPGQPLTFHRGASYLAIRAAKTLTPVYIRCVPTTLTKAEPWYRIPPRPIRFTLQVGDDFDLAPYQVMRSVPMASRALNEHLRAQFQRELQHADEIY